jgi:hypothetical protein
MPTSGTVPCALCPVRWPKYLYVKCTSVLQYLLRTDSADGTGLGAER